MNRETNIKNKLKTIPNTPGVYMMRDRLGRIIYVGKAKDLKKRVSSYFHPAKKSMFLKIQPKVAALIALVHDIDFTEVKNEAEAILLEGRLIKQWKPRYNTFAKDDKKFLMVKVDIENQIPQFKLTRNRIDKKALYFGPFANPAELRKTLHEMRLKFGILLGDSHPQHIEGQQYRLYSDVRAEIYGHKNDTTLTEYRDRVDRACKFLEGKTRDWIQETEGKMIRASGKKQYEKAATYRDLLHALRKTLEPSRKFKAALKLFKPTVDPVNELQRSLELKSPPSVIECFDISHISGSFVVASMVSFKNGYPNKSQYRMYKIKTFIGNDDYRAMEEIVGRRYTRLSQEGINFPDLILIDGGQGQVNAALKAFLIHNLVSPTIVGLAKKRETIIFADGRKPLNLPLNSSALFLLQRVRDEAHRFANAFNADLRSKKLRESILDDFEGIGPVRKEALLKHFKSISHLKSATIKELQVVPGIGQKIAEELKKFLSNL